MKLISVRLLPAGLLLHLIAGVALAQKPEAATSKAAQFWSRVAKARTVAYTVREWSWEPAEAPNQKPPYIFIIRTYDVKVQRPNMQGDCIYYIATIVNNRESFFSLLRTKP